MNEDRTYQGDCVKAVVENYLAGIYQQLVVMATGTGKTWVFALLIGALRKLIPGKVLVFAHREELVDQAIETIRFLNPELKVGKEMAQHWADSDCDVVVSCVASIGREGSTRLHRFGDFGLVICDEAHHSIAPSYLNVMETTGVLKLDSKRLLLGFTATPKRKNLRKEKEVTTLDNEDLISLKSVYKKIVYTYTIRRAIKEGWLVPLRVYRLKSDVNLDTVKVTAGEYQQDELSEAVNTPERNLKAVRAWLDGGENRQTVGFTVDIKHAEDMAALFRHHGIKAEAIWGEDPERKEKLKKHQNKEITALFNAQVLTEGYDDWRVSCIMLLAPSKSPSKIMQEMGRGTRLQKGKGNLLEALKAGIDLEKRDCIVFDMVDNSKRNTLVTVASLFGLNPDIDLRGHDIIESVEKLEKAQEEYPSIDFSQLKDIDKVKAFVEEVDIFSTPFPEEIDKYTKLRWLSQSDGSYVLVIPDKQVDSKGKKIPYGSYLREKLHVYVNELDEWELSITHKDKITYVDVDRKLGTFNTLEEAIKTADDVIRRCRNDRMDLMKRYAPWHNYPASDKVKNMLRRMSKGRQLLWCICEESTGTGVLCTTCNRKKGLSAGQASTALEKLKHVR